MPSNQAAYLTEKGAPLTVHSAPYLEPKPTQILIKNHAVAINPVDWAIQKLGVDNWHYMTLPIILGFDVAGTVAAVGSSITRVKVGDRVLGMADGGHAHGGGFQEYTLVAHNLFSPIPDGLSFEEACVVPICAATAACGLFEKDQLALPYPTLEPKKLGKTLLIWSGASSVGCNAIQLAVAAGCEVVTTCSPKNNELMRKLGASAAFDYASETVVEDIVKYLEGKTIAGAMAIGNIDLSKGLHDMTGTKQVLEIVSRSQGNKFVAVAMPFTLEIPEGVEAKFFRGDSLAQNELGDAIFAEFLPKALAEGKFVAAPEPLVVGKGLERLQQAFDVQMKGVSAKKVVVTL